MISEEIVLKGTADLSEIKKELARLRDEVINAIEPIRKGMTSPFKEVIPREQVEQYRDLNKQLNVTTKQYNLMQKQFVGEEKGPIMFQEQIRGAELAGFREAHKEFINMREVIKTTRKELVLDADGVEHWATKVSYAGRQAQRFKMHLLSIMFFGMALGRMWKEHTDSLSQMFGLTDLHAAAMEYLLLPAYEDVANAMMGFDEWILGLDENTRLWIGRILLLVQGLGNMLFMVGQFGLGMDGLSRMYDSWKGSGMGDSGGVLDKTKGFLEDIWTVLKNIGSKIWTATVTFAMFGWERVLHPALIFLADKGFFMWTDKAWQLTVNFAHKLATGFSSFFSASAAWLKGAVSTTVSFLMGTLDKALSGFMNLLGLGGGGWLRAAVGELAVKIKMVAGGIGTKLAGFFANIGLGGEKLWAAGGVAVMTLMMIPILSEAFEFGKKIGSWIGEGMVETWMRATEGEEAVGKRRAAKLLQNLGLSEVDVGRYGENLKNLAWQGKYFKDTVLEELSGFTKLTLHSVSEEWVWLMDEASNLIQVSTEKFGRAIEAGNERVKDMLSVSIELGNGIRVTGQQYAQLIELASIELGKAREDITKSDVGIIFATTLKNNMNNYEKAMELARTAHETSTEGFVDTIDLQEGILSDSVNRARGSYSSDFLDYNNQIDEVGNVLANTVELQKLNQATAFNSLSSQMENSTTKVGNTADELKKSFIKLEDALTYAKFKDMWNQMFPDSVRKVLSAFGIKLPKFAEGGVVNRPTIGVIGEEGPEIIMPVKEFSKQTKESVRVFREQSEILKTFYTPADVETPFAETKGLISELAVGGIVTKPTLAMVGERGPEAVIPLNRGNTKMYGDIYINVPIYVDKIDRNVDINMVAGKVATVLQRELAMGVMR